jgi:hypothetical protein
MTPGQSGTTYVPGAGDAAFAKDVKNAEKLAAENFKKLGDQITQGYSLRDVYRAIAGKDKKAPETAYRTTASALEIKGNYSNALDQKTDDKGNKILALNSDAKRNIIQQRGLLPGQIFKYKTSDGYTSFYKVNESGTDATRIESKRMYDGGKISGPGTATSDSIPIMASDGEFMIRAAAVDKYGAQLFDAYNNMKVPVTGKAMGGIISSKRYEVPRMAMGGYINMNEGGRVSGSNALYNINVTLEGSNLDANDVARAISREMQLREARNGVSRNRGG